MPRALLAVLWSAACAERVLPLPESPAVVPAPLDAAASVVGNGPLHPPEDPCGAVHFAVFGDTVEAPYLSDFDFSSSFTVEAWVYLEQQPDPNNRAIVVAHSGSFVDRHGYVLVLYAGELWFSVSGDGWSLRASPQLGSDRLTIGAWHHVAGTFSSPDGRAIAYLDGEPAREADEQVPAPFALPGLPLVMGGPVVIGAPGPLLGYLDDVRVSRGVRYAGRFTPAPSLEADADTVVMFHFNEHLGTTALDASPAHDHATLRGAVFAHPPACR
jgi:hypothetical protein